MDNVSMVFGLAHIFSTLKTGELVNAQPINNFSHVKKNQRQVIVLAETKADNLGLGPGRGHSCAMGFATWADHDGRGHRCQLSNETNSLSLITRRAINVCSYCGAYLIGRWERLG